MQEVGLNNGGRRRRRCTTLRWFPAFVRSFVYSAPRSMIDRFSVISILCFCVLYSVVIQFSNALINACECVIRISVMLLYSCLN